MTRAPTPSELVESHLDLPHCFAFAIYNRCRKYVELEDVIALGNVGLAEAAERFDPSYGVPFHAYARYRVEGAILDGIRRLAPLPRGVWQRLVELRSARARLWVLVDGRNGKLDAKTASQLAYLKKEIDAVRPLYFVSVVSESSHAHASANDARSQLQTEQLLEVVAQAVEDLPEREREMMRKHYWGGQNLMQAGVDLGVSKATASRIHSSALVRLRARCARVVAEWSQP